jgi:Tfp pilus assembly protein PilF
MKKPKLQSTKTTIQNTTTKKTYLNIWLAGILAIIAFGLYSNTLNHGYVMDDFAAINGNKFVQKGFAGIHDILTSSYWHGMSDQTGGVYRPLSLIMFAIEWQLAPNNSAIGHWINVLLYAFTAVILFFFIKRITLQQAPIFAFAVSLLWVVHPLHTEVVANIKSRDEILCLLFGLLSIFQALYYLESKRIVHLICFMVFYILALFSKETALSYVIIISLTIYFFNTPGKKEIWILAILAIVCALIYFMTKQMLLGSIYQSIKIPIQDNSLAGAKNVMQQYATAIFILAFYLYKFFVPIVLASDYSYNQIPLVDFTNPFALLALISLGVIIYFAIRNFTNKNQFSYGIFFFMLTIALVSNFFFLLGSTMADRFMYQPSLGLCLATIFILNKCIDLNTLMGSLKNLFQSWRSISCTCLYIVVILCFSYKSFTRNYDWKSNLSLFSKDIMTVPNNVKMKYFYELAVYEDVKKQKGDPVKQQAKLDHAMQELQKAIKIDSNYFLLYNAIAELYNYMKLPQKAIEYYRTGIRKNPLNVDGMGNLGNLYFRAQRYDSAEYFQKLAISLSPNSYLNYYNLGAAQFQQQRYDEAVQSFQKAIQLYPGYADAYKNLGTTYTFMNKYEEALQAYTKALNINPNNATVLYNLGLVYERMGDPVKAESFKNKARAIDPSIR